MSKVIVPVASTCMRILDIYISIIEKSFSPVLGIYEMKIYWTELKEEKSSCSADVGKVFCRRFW